MTTSAPKMRRVVLVSNEVMHYRVSVYNYLWKRFQQDGWEFIVRTNKLQKQNEHSISFDIREIKFSFPHYAKEMKRISPDVIIFFLHMKDTLLWPLIHWAKLMKIPAVYWTKGVNLDDADNKMKYILFNYLHTISDGLILYSENEMKYIRERNRHKVHVANNTINYHDFPEIHETKQDIKRDLGLNFEKIVLFAGRMGVGGGRKKVDHLVRIFSEIHDGNVGLVIVGSDMPDQVKNMMNKKNTVYLGEVHDPKNIKISRLFKAADVFSIPGHVGLGLNQAMFWGLPVVTEQGLQPPEIAYLSDGRNGYIVPEDDIDALKEKIFELLRDDQKRTEVGQNARADLLARASIEGMYNAFRDCAESVIAAKQKRITGAVDITMGERK